MPEGGRIRLPTEAHWELATRWNGKQADDRLFPWRVDSIDADLSTHSHCNWDGTKIGHTSAVGLFPSGKATCGAHDLAGNVWEWCRTKWINPDDKEALKKSNSGVYDADDGEESRVLRGGSWVFNDPSNLRCCDRGNFHPDVRSDFIGFRCVVVGWGSSPA